MPTRSLLLIPLAVLLLGAGGFAGWYYLIRKPPALLVVEVGQAKERETIPVPPVKFTDVTAPAGISFRHENGLSGKKLLPETMGGGVAVLDFDRDGRQDLLFVNSCPWPGHEGRDRKATPALYRNAGGGNFEDITEKAGLKIPLYGMGAAVGDIDNDGWPDLFVSCVGEHRLYRNDGGKKFLDVTKNAGVGGGELPDCSFDEFLQWEKPIPFGSSATFLDYDGDGRLDLFVCHYVTWSPAHDLHVSTSLRGGDRSFAQPKEFAGSQCKLFRNTDGKRFEDVTETAGLIVTQSDRDRAERHPASGGQGARGGRLRPGRRRLAGPRGRQRHGAELLLPQRRRPGRQAKVSGGRRPLLAGLRRSGGAARRHGHRLGRVPAGPVRRRRDQLRPGAEYLLPTSRRQALRFSDAALAFGLAGPSRRPLKFGAFFFDFDLDGRLDLLTCNGHIEPDITDVQTAQKYEQPAQLFWNTGTNPLFEPATTETAGADLFQPLVGRGSAYLDYDGDGDLDVVLVDNGGPARLLRNDTAGAQVGPAGAGRGRGVEPLGDRGRGDGRGRRAGVPPACGRRRGYLSQSEADHRRPRVSGENRQGDGPLAGEGCGEPQVWTNLTPTRTYELKQGDAKSAPR